MKERKSIKRGSKRKRNTKKNEKIERKGRMEIKKIGREA
jgi:hypothetical protein